MTPVNNPVENQSFIIVICFTGDNKMQHAFFDDISKFAEKLKKDSQQFKGQQPFEHFMKGLSEGKVKFRWRFGGRLTPSFQEGSTSSKAMWWRYGLSAPFIYSMGIPVLFLDICVSLYQAVCFRLWKIPQIKRSKYIIIDRQYLSYLKGYQKINCAYCGYATGVINYARAVAARTEHYWCPLKHKSNPPDAHDFYIEFVDYNDAEGWVSRNEDNAEINI